MQKEVEEEAAAEAEEIGRRRSSSGRARGRRRASAKAIAKAKKRCSRRKLVRFMDAKARLAQREEHIGSSSCAARVPILTD